MGSEGDNFLIPILAPRIFPWHSKTSTPNLIIKFPYNLCPDWLKQHALSENREQVDDVKIFAWEFEKFDPN